jgi:hypothetical protein
MVVVLLQLTMACCGCLCFYSTLIVQSAAYFHSRLKAYCYTVTPARHAQRTRDVICRVSPFGGPLLSSPAFLGRLCPMLRSLKLSDVRSPISAAQFASICRLSSLEELDIGGYSCCPTPEVNPRIPPSPCTSNLACVFPPDYR